MAKKPARPIRNERDFKGAAQATKKILAKAERESAEELRLQALIKVMSDYDGEAAYEEEDVDADEQANDCPRRRWSDEPSGD